MNRATDKIINLFNFRTLIVVIALWLCLANPPPHWFAAAKAGLDHALFRIAMDFSALPVSQTQLTVVHVPPVEYEAWLADVPGAARLEKLLNAGPQAPPLTLGVVLERPLSLIQSQAESLLGEIQQGRRSKDHLYEEVNALLNRREQLVASLRAPNLVLGIEHSYFGTGTAVATGTSTPWNERIHPVIKRWLWPEAGTVGELRARQPVFDYAPVISSTGLARPLVVHTGEQVSAGFELAFLRSASGAIAGQEPKDSANPAIEWLPDEGFRIGERTYQASVFGEVIPLYGAHSQLRSALRQLSLDAALAAGDLRGWVLVGKDGSQTLESLAQTIAAIADGAVIVEPLWWSPVKKVLILLLAALMCLALPRFSRYWKLTSAALLTMALVLTALLGQSIHRLWLPVSDLLLFIVAGLVLIVLWQKQANRIRELQGRTQAALVDLADQLALSGHPERALGALARGHADESVLNRYYLLAETLTQQRKLAPALAALEAIHKAKPRYRDVAFKIEALSKQLETQRLLAEEAALGEPRTEQAPALVDADNKPPMLGGYEIRRELGRGAHGTVFLGYDPKSDAEVTIKTVHLQACDEATRERIVEGFFAQARTVGRLSHPDIIEVYDVGEEDNLAYMAMAYVEGYPLSEYTQTAQRLAVDEVYRIVARVADALNYAHQQELVHRDLKPSNILFVKEPFQVKVTDFGISRVLNQGQSHADEASGSLMYMAPEQLQNEPVTGATDVFSLGVIFYQLLTGQLPFQGTTTADTRHAITQLNHISVRKLRKDLPTSATRITNIALQKKPEHRFETAKAFSDALKTALAQDFGIDSV